MFPTDIDAGESTYTYFGKSGDDKLIYHSDSHTDQMRDQLEFIRTNPKRSGQDFGVRRAFCRYTKDIEVDRIDGTTAVAPIVATWAVNWPTGLASPTTHLKTVIHSLQSLVNDPTDWTTGDNTVSSDIAWSESLATALLAFVQDGALR
jgi:hypothetical protein